MLSEGLLRMDGCPLHIQCIKYFGREWQQGHRAEVVGMAEYLPLLLTEPEVPKNSQWRVLEDVSKKISGRRGVYNQTKVWNSGLWPWRSFEWSQGPGYALWAGVRRKMEEREEDVRNWEVGAYIKGKGWDKVEVQESDIQISDRWEGLTSASI